MTNKRIIGESKADAMKKLNTKIAIMKADIEKAEEDLRNIDDYIVILPSMLSKPFNKLSLAEQNTIYNTNKKVYEWFIKEEGNEFITARSMPNNTKSLQDYIDEGQAAGKVNFYEI